MSDVKLSTLLGELADRLTEATKVSPAEDVKAALDGKHTKTGGRLHVLQAGTSAHGPFVRLEPEHRERLDHYVGANYFPGEDEDPEGWDSEGWKNEYAGPLRREVEEILKAARIVGWTVDIGEKGHVLVEARRR